MNTEQFIIAAMRRFGSLEALVEAYRAKDPTARAWILDPITLAAAELGRESHAEPRPASTGILRSIQNSPEYARAQAVEERRWLTPVSHPAPSAREPVEPQSQPASITPSSSSQDDDSVE